MNNYDVIDLNDDDDDDCHPVRTSSVKRLHFTGNALCDLGGDSETTTSITRNNHVYRKPRVHVVRSVQVRTGVPESRIPGARRVSPTVAHDPAAIARLSSGRFVVPEARGRISR